MKWTKKKIGVIIAIVVIVIAVIMFIISNIGIEKVDQNEIANEIIPEEEISDQQLRETTVSLYFINGNNEIISEIRKVDSKVLLNNPYYESIKLLLEGPTSEDVRSSIPENTKLNNVVRNGEVLVIDFSKEFIENQNENVEEEGLAISQIVDTVTQFTEINSVKILIDGEENKVSKSGSIRYEQIFTKED